MLGRAIAKRVASRATLPRTFIATFHQSAPFLKRDQSKRPPKTSPFESEDASGNGPVPNRTWAPDTSGRPQRVRNKGQFEEDPTEEQLHDDIPSISDRSKSPRTKPTPIGTGATKEDVEAQGTDFSVQQPEFETVASRARGKDPEVESAAKEDQLPSETDLSSGNKPSDTPSPTGPLPDLRQGIPSTFGEEYSDKSSSFQSKDAQDPSLNVTEDPAKPNARKAGGGRGGDLPKDAYVSSIDRRRNALANYLYLTAFGFLAAGAVWLGQNWETDEEAQRHPDVPNGYWPSAFYGRASIRLSKMLGYYTEPAFPQLLPELDPKMRPSPYTLVLSLEDLLINSKWSRQKGWEVAKRPGVDYFLRYLSQYYELVIFTTVQKMNAEPVVAKLDPFRIVMWPLYREATRYVNGEPVKDLSYLNRDLSKVVVLDTVPSHVQVQPENAVILPKWKGDKNDPSAKDLVGMIPFLEFIAASGMEDVRKMVKSFEGTHIPTEFAKREEKSRADFNKRMGNQEGKSSRFGNIGGSIASALGFKPGASQMVIPGEPTTAEGFAQGKTLADQARERGQRGYEQLQAEITKNGQAWLDEMKAEEKKMMEEQMESIKSGMSLSSLFGFGGGSSGDDGKKK